MSKFLTHLFYAGDTPEPTLRFSDASTLMPLAKTLSLSFDTSKRFCIGWHDMETGENHPCPDAMQLQDMKFETCPACQRRTGFNPAFYHTTKVSPQQEVRNAQPHILYLAYMGDGYIKVGISWGERGTKRLLDQGARAGLILDTFPTAAIARQYEAKIARLDGMHETTPTRVKLALLAIPVDTTTASTQLLAAKQRIESALAVSFSGDTILLFDQFYTQNGTLPAGPISPQKNPLISGRTEAVVGDILITQYEHRRLALPLRQYTGYPVAISDDITPLDFEPEQLGLF